MPPLLLRRRLLLLQLTLLTLILARAAAAQSNRCTAFNLMGDACDVQGICSRCAASDGCMFDIFQGRCDIATTPVKYCGVDDDVCASCAVTGSRPVCYGRDSRCICPSLCAVVKSPRAACNGEQINVRLYLTFGAFALVLPLLLYLQRKWNEPGGVQHMLYHRRLRHQRQLREQQRDASRDLELAAWRDHCELHKIEMRDVELKTCYLQMDDAAVPTAGGAAVPPLFPLEDASACERAASSTAASADPMTTTTTTALPFVAVEDDDESKRNDGDDAASQSSQVAVVVEKP